MVPQNPKTRCAPSNASSRCDASNRLLPTFFFINQPHHKVLIAIAIDVTPIGNYADALPTLGLPSFAEKMLPD